MLAIGRKMRIFIALVIVIMAVLAVAAVLLRRGVEEIQVGETTRSYFVYVPPSYDGSQPVPLVLAFHGGGASGRTMPILTGLNDIADREGFIVVYPNAYKRRWNDGRTPKNTADDIGFTAALLDHLMKTYNIDSKRVYATGMSNGAMFTHRLACELSDRIAAIAPVAGTMPDTLAANCRPSRPVPVLMFHGTDDRQVNWNGGQISVAGDERGAVLSTPATAIEWVRINDCKETPVRLAVPDRDTDDGAQVREEIYRDCRDDAEVVLYAVAGGGHTWPGGFQYLPPQLIGNTTRDIDASELMWDFFARHPLN